MSQPCDSIAAGTPIVKLVPQQVPGKTFVTDGSVAYKVVKYDPVVGFSPNAVATFVFTEHVAGMQAQQFWEIDPL